MGGQQSMLSALIDAGYMRGYFKKVSKDRLQLSINMQNGKVYLGRSAEALIDLQKIIPAKPKPRSQVPHINLIPHLKSAGETSHAISNP